MRLDFTQEADRGRATSHVRNVLARGGTLSRLLLNRVDEAVNYRGLVVDGVVVSRVQNFEHGLTEPSDSERSIGWQRVLAPQDELAEEIARGSVGSSAWVLEDTVARRGDPFLDSVDKSLVAYVDSDLYWVVSPGPSPAAALKALDWGPPSWQLVGVKTKLPSESGTKWSPTTIEHLASAATQLLVGAFDGEGYVLCDLPESQVSGSSFSREN